MRTITHVAVKFGGVTYSLPRPNRHHNVIYLIANTTGKGMYGPHSEGFLDDEGTYLSRADAMELTVENGQFNRRTSKEHYQGPELYSEDIW